MKNILVNKNIRLFDALKKLSLSGEKTLIIINKARKLLGTISDGDIRRNILKRNNLNNKIEKIYNKNPTYLIEGKYNKKDIKDIFLKKHFDLIPILNQKKIVINYISWSEFFNTQENKFDFKKINNLVIMAGGEGTRMKPFTDLFPKPLIPIRGKPIIDLIIEKFSNFNIKKFTLSVRTKSKILKTYLSEKKYKNLNYVEEKKPLGTVGSLSLLKRKFNEDFLLTNCDILADINLESFYNFHKKNNHFISMVVSAKKFSIPYGVCTVNNNGVFNSIKEKPNYNFFVNIGLYLMSPKVIKYIPKNKFFHMTDLIKVLIKKKLSVGAYPIQDTEWVDVGQWSEYKKTLETIE